MMGWWGGETQVWDLRRCGNQPLAAWELGKNFRKLGKTVFGQIERLGKPGVTTLAGRQTILIISSISFSVGRTQNSYIERNFVVVRTRYIWIYVHTYILKEMPWYWEAPSEASLHLQITQIWRLSFMSSLWDTIFVHFWCETSVRWRSERRPLSTFVASCAIISKFPKSCVLLTRPCFSNGLVPYCCCCL